MSKKKALDRIEHIVKKCKECSLNETCSKPVFGEGNFNARIMFIGEAPGRNEDELGRPFVGKAGKIFDEMLVAIGISRNNVYISNILKCRPPKNRNPSKIEIKKCSDYIDKQIEIISPDIIVPMGNYANNYIFNKFKLKIEKISKIHGKIYSVNSYHKKLKIIPIHHPAAAIYNKIIKNNLLKDFKIIKKNI